MQAPLQLQLRQQRQEEEEEVLAPRLSSASRCMPMH
jgi:hypothetical protein